MQSFASNSLPSSPLPGRARSRPTADVLPSPRDERYPRPWWFRSLRTLADVWWLPVAVYGGYGVAAVLLRQTQADAPPLSVDTAASALGLGDAFSFLAQQPLLFAGCVVVLVALLGSALWLQHVAAVDRRREVAVYMLRQANASELGNPVWMRDALFPALRWRMHTLLRSRILVQTALLLAALLLGAVLALLFSGSLVAGAVIR